MSAGQRRAAFLAARIAVSAGLIGWLLSWIDVSDLASSIGRIGVGGVAVVLGLQVVNTSLKSYKWQRLLAADGIALTHREAFASYMVGTFFNLFLPTSIGGDAVRAVDTARRRGRGLESATSVAADRVLGFVALGLLGLGSLAVGSAAGIGRTHVTVALLAYGGVIGMGGFLFTPAAGALARRVAQVPRLSGASRIAASLDAYRGRARIGELLAVSLAAQSIVVAAVWWIARSLEIPVGLPYFFAVVPLVSLVEAVPVSIYGVGLRDVSYVYLLGLAGVDEASALSVSVLWVVLTIGYAATGGVVFVLRRGATS